VKRLKDSLARSRTVGGWSKECPSLNRSGRSMAPDLLFYEFSCVSEGHWGQHSCNQGRALPHCQGFTRSQIRSLEALVRLGDGGKPYDKKREVCLSRRRARQFRSAPQCNSLLCHSRMPIADELREVFTALFLGRGTASVYLPMGIERAQP
jgi:hypothetical protein